MKFVFFIKSNNSLYNKMFVCKKKFWIENPSDLLCSANIIPTTTMSLEEQMNCFSRFVIILFLFILIFMSNSITSFIFLFVSLLFIIILYYIKKRMDYQKENYKNYVKSYRNCNPKYNFNQHKLTENVNTKVVDNSVKESYLLNKKRLLSSNNQHISLNQKLVGPSNPKTLVKPIIPPPITDIDFWKANNLINHSHINTQSTWDTYLSGYDVTDCDNNEFIFSSKLEKNRLDTIIEDLEYPVQDQSKLSPEKKNHSYDDDDRYSAIRKTTVKEGYHGSTFNSNDSSFIGKNTIHLQHLEYNKNPSIPNITENFEYPYLKEKQTKNEICDNDFGLINTTSGYNHNQVTESNLPSNLAAGKCERDEKMKEYNKNLFTQNIQSDIYTKSEIIEPINSNIGISFTQQFGPKTYSKDDKGITYIQHDQKNFQPNIEPHKLDTNVTEADVYDPRFYGYGTSYRCYTDKNTGQPRFYYDDVNAIRMPNYLVRSNIDFTKYADSYGPLRDDNKNGNQYNSNIRDLANDTFLQSSLQHRTELQERLMSKRNNELWQLRKYPMHTFGQKR